MWYRDFYPRSRPRAVKGGIKAQSKGGSFGTNWWAKRWLAVLESFRFGARLARGRTYARSGQVLNIEVGKGEVQARVQGSRPKPYDVSIAVKVLTPGQWREVLRVLSGQALFVAKLLAGEMPPDIEQAFQQARLSLFPAKRGDLRTDCSCPDDANPCKHIAAVYYLLGEEFDRDPFLLFRLRGLGREELLAQLGAAAGQGEAAPAKAEGEASAAPAAPPEPLPADAAAFWGGGELSDDLFGAVQAPPVSAGWVRRLGKFPFWRGEVPLLDAVEPAYEQAAPRGLSTFLGERGGKGGAGR
jgi:uncharacterized Zn finger protein